MKHLVKLLCLSAALAVAPLAYAIPISGSVGFGGNGSYNSTTNQFTAGSTIGNTGGNAYVNTASSGTLSMFTMFNPATFFSFNSVTGLPQLVFTTTQAGTTLSFKLTAFTADGPNPAGPGFSGSGILSETGYTDTAATFTLNTNTSAGTFITFNTATVATTPEPSSLVLLGSGLVSAAGMLIRRRRLI